MREEGVLFVTCIPTDYNRPICIRVLNRIMKTYQEEREDTYIHMSFLFVCERQEPLDEISNIARKRGVSFSCFLNPDDEDSCPQGDTDPDRWRRITSNKYWAGKAAHTHGGDWKWMFFCDADTFFKASHLEDVVNELENKWGHKSVFKIRCLLKGTTTLAPASFAAFCHHRDVFESEYYNVLLDPQQAPDCQLRSSLNSKGFRTIDAPCVHTEHYSSRKDAACYTWLPDTRTIQSEVRELSDNTDAWDMGDDAEDIDNRIHFGGHMHITPTITNRAWDRQHLYTVVIPYTHICPVRLKRLKETVTFYRDHIGMSDILVVESGTNVTENILPAGVRVLCIPGKEGDPNQFSRGMSFNAGFLYSDNKFLLLTDADYLVPLYALKRYKEDENMFRPTDIVRYLDEDLSNRFVEGGYKFVDVEGKGRKTQGFRGGACVISREAFFDVGGFTPGYRGWGAEDDEFWYKCSKLDRGPAQCGGFSVHLNHPPAPQFQRNPHYTHNVRILQNTQAATVSELKDKVKTMQDNLVSIESVLENKDVWL